MGIMDFIKVKPKWNCIVRILREIDGNVEELSTMGKMELDQRTGVVRLKSKNYSLDEPAIPYRYFKRSGKFRVIYFYNPQAGVFRPIEYELITVYNKNVVKANSERCCIYCEYKKHKEEKKEQALKFKEYVKGKKEIAVCAIHSASLIKSKFKVISEERKEWYAQKEINRMMRSMSNKPKWWESPTIQMAIMAMMFIIAFVVIIKYGGGFLKEIIEEAFKKGAENAAEILYNMPPK